MRRALPAATRSSRESNAGRGAFVEVLVDGFLTDFLVIVLRMLERAGNDIVSSDNAEPLPAHG